MLRVITGFVSFSHVFNERQLWTVVVLQILDGKLVTMKSLLVYVYGSLINYLDY